MAVPLMFQQVGLFNPFSFYNRTVVHDDDASLLRMVACTRLRTGIRAVGWCPDYFCHIDGLCNYVMLQMKPFGIWSTGSISIKIAK